MKKIKTTLLVVVFMFGTLVNYANDKEVNGAISAKRTKVIFKGAKKGHQLKIKDSNGVVLHSENVRKEGNLIKFFDFTTLKDGNYTLELEKDFEIIIKPLKIKDETVIFNENAEEVIFKPVIRNEENRVMISQISFDEKPLNITLYYKNEIIYSETLEEDVIINRVYKLDEEIKGNYTVIVRNNGRSYVNEFKI